MQEPISFCILLETMTMLILYIIIITRGGKIEFEFVAKLFLPIWEQNQNYALITDLGHEEVISSHLALFLS